jgi:hypothetical protein
MPKHTWNVLYGSRFNCTRVGRGIRRAEGDSVWRLRTPENLLRCAFRSTYHHHTQQKEHYPVASDNHWSQPLIHGKIFLHSWFYEGTS